MTTLNQSQLLAGEHTPPTPGSERAWPLWRFVGAVSVVLLSIYILRTSWDRMLNISLTDEESSHVLLVPLAALWILFNRRHLLAKCRPTATWLGPVLVAVGWASHLYGYDIHDNEYWFFGTILMAVGGLVAFVGGQVLWRLAPVFIVLGFLIPVPGLFRELISLPLQSIMAQVAQGVGDLVGFMIDRTGSVLIINGQSIEIAEACNGMRMVFALFLVAYTVAFATPLKPWVRALLLLGAPPLALLCNLIRILPTIWLYGQGSQELADQFHDLAGWGMVIVAYLLLMGFIELLDWTGLDIMQTSKGGR